MFIFLSFKPVTKNYMMFNPRGTNQSSGPPQQTTVYLEKIDKKENAFVLKQEILGTEASDGAAPCGVNHGQHQLVVAEAAGHFLGVGPHVVDQDVDTLRK